MIETDVYTVPETAERLRAHPQTVYAAIRAGKLPAVRIGRKIVVPRRALEEFLNGRTLASTDRD